MDDQLAAALAGPADRLGDALAERAAIHRLHLLQREYILYCQYSQNQRDHIQLHRRFPHKQMRITGERNIGARHVQSGCFVLVSLTKIWGLKPSIRCADCLLCMLLHPLFPPHNVFAACLISAIGNPKAGTSKHDSMPFLPLMPLNCPRSEKREQPKITITKFCQEYSPTTSRLQFTVYRYIATAIYNRFYAFVCRLNDGRIVICKRNTQFCRLISVNRRFWHRLQRM